MTTKNEDIFIKFTIAFIRFTITAIGLAAAAIAQPILPPYGPGSPHFSGALTEFDAPGAGTAAVPACAPICGTVPLANNDRGDIVGFYTDPNIVPHAFLRTSDGQFLSFDAPAAGLGAGLDQGTVAYSINNRGVIGGRYQDPNYLFHAFIRGADGSFNTFDVPQAGTGANQGSLVFDINMEGSVAGVYIDSNNTQHGFVRTADGKIATFDPTGAAQTMLCLETCLNSTGVAVGFWLDALQTIHGFARSPDGAITVIDAPGAGIGSYFGTYVASINDTGEITGYTVDQNYVGHAFVRTLNGEFTSLDAPQAGRNGLGTVSYSINASGAVTGSYWDENNVVRRPAAAIRRQPFERLARGMEGGS